MSTSLFQTMHMQRYSSQAGALRSQQQAFIPSARLRRKGIDYFIRFYRDLPIANSRGGIVMRTFNIVQSR